MLPYFPCWTLSEHYRANLSQTSIAWCTLLQSLWKSKGIRSNCKSCRVRVPVAFGSEKQLESSPDLSAERWKASKTLLLPETQLKTSFYMTAQRQEYSRQAAQQNLMGQMYSLVDHLQPQCKKLQLPSDTAVSVPIPIRAWICPQPLRQLFMIL